MTLLELINTCNTFYAEYSTSRDPDVMKLCAFIKQVTYNLNMYSQYLTKRKTTLDQKQQTYAEYLVTLNQLLGIEDSGGDTTP